MIFFCESECFLNFCLTDRMWWSSLSKDRREDEDSKERKKILKLLRGDKCEDKDVDLISYRLERERKYLMRRGDCRWWTMSNRIRSWSSASLWVTPQSARPGWFAQEPATNTCPCLSCLPPTCPRSGPSTSTEFTRT